MKILWKLSLTMFWLLVGLTQGQAQCPVAASCTPGNAPSSNAPFQGGIFNVTFGSINRTSGGMANGYEDLSCTMGTAVTAGSPMAISVTAGTFYNENVRVWIDYNNDGVLNASTELAFSSNNKMVHTGNITVPASAVTNTPLRMRVLSDAVVTSPSSLTPCFTPQFSQAEDYRVTVSSNTQQPDPNFVADDSVICSGTVNFTDLSTNVPTTWEWHFGDGNTSTLQNPTHTYALPGTYTVKLIVSNASGIDSLIKTNYINYSANAPIAANCTPATTAYCCGYGITSFTIGSLSNSSADASVGYEDFTCGMSVSLTEGVNIPFSMTTGSNPEDVGMWLDMNNDGIFTASERLYTGIAVTNPSGTINIPGGAVLNTPLRLRVLSDFTGGPALTPCNNLTNGQAEDYTVTILMNTNAPVAAFTKVQNTCSFTVNFIDQSTNAPTSFIWDFGDGNTSTAKNPSHTYATSGTYSVSLTATNANGSDTELKTSYINVSIHNTFPYFQDFENGNGGWTLGGTNSSWALGTPAKSIINSAASGTKAWTTKLTGFYNPNEQSWVNSNCFDFSSLVDPVIEMKIWWYAQRFFDGAVLQSSVDGGVTWQRVGSINDPVNMYNMNWYNTTLNPGNTAGGQNQVWSGTGNNSSGGYVTAKHDLTGLGGEPSVMLRVAFGSNGFTNSNGFAFDDVQIYDKPADDLGVSAVLAPSSDCGYTSTETVTVRIKNYGIAAQSNFPVSFKLNSGAAVTENFSGTIPAGDSADHTFSQTVDLSTPGNYALMAYTGLTGDMLLFNDTTVATFISKPLISSFSHYQDFESGNGGWTAGGTNSSWQFGTPAGSVISGASSGTNAWATGLLGNHNNSEQSWVESGCFDFSSLVDPIITLDIWWSSSDNIDGTVLQSSIDGGATWQRVGNVNDPENWYNTANFFGGTSPGGQNQGWSGLGATSSGGYVTAKHDLTGLGGQHGVMLRIAFASNNFTNNNGFAFDNVHIYDKPEKDLGVSRILSPSNGCGNTATEAVTVRIRNYGIVAQSNIPVSFVVDNGTVYTETYAGSIPEGDSVDFTFAQTADLSTFTTYNLESYTSFPGDALPNNDMAQLSITSIPTVASYPYFEDFESGNGGWMAQGTNSSWALGTPANSVINSAASGSNSWLTNLNGNYNHNEDSWVISNCFDFTTLIDPIISMKVWWSIEGGWDGAVLQSSKDGGNTWQRVGNVGDPNNWYNQNNINANPGGQSQGWSGEGGLGSGAWVVAKHDLTGLAGEPAVRLRIAFASDQIIDANGIAFDDITIYDKPTDDLGVSSLLSPAHGCGLTSSETVTVRIVNYGTMAQSNIDVGYMVNNGSSVIETYTGTIPAQDSAVYTFTQTADLSTPGTFAIKSFTAFATDMLLFNDTLQSQIVSIPTVSTFPYSEDFESGNGGWTSGGTNNSWALGTPAGAVINSAASGTNAWVTGLASVYNNNEQSYVKSNCFDFTTLIDPIIELDIWWQSQTNVDGAVLQSSIDGGVTWQRVGTFNDPVNWYNTSNFFGGVQPGGQSQGWSGFGTAGSGGYLTAKHDLTGLAGQSGVIFRIAFASNNFNQSDGFAFDNVNIYDRPADDVGVSRVMSPTDGCGFTTTEQVTVRIINYGTAAQSNIGVSFKLNNNSPVNETYGGTVVPGDSVDYTFTQTIDLTTAGTYSLVSYTSLAGDALAFNDTAQRPIVSKPTISTFPYLIDFESGHGGWSSGGQNSTWALGMPSGSALTTAASGTNAWVTNLSGNYNNNEQSWVMSTCMDFSTLVDPIISMSIWWSIENGWDGAVLQSSIDGGATWQRVGNVNDPVNWYNSTNVNSSPGGQPQGWTGFGTLGSGGWVTAKHDLTGLGGQSSVELRIAFSSDVSGTFDGFAFDDVLIYDKPADDLGVSRVLAPSSGCGYTSAESVTVRIRNFGIASQSNIPVSFELNGGAAVTENYNGTIPAGDSIDYTFTQTIDLSTPGNYTILAYTGLLGDMLLFNDTTEVTIISVPTVSTFPYYEDFESGNGGWTSGGTNSSWEFGTPAGTVISGASSGSNAWATRLFGNHNNNEQSWVESNCFDFSSLVAPIIELDVWWSSEANVDGAVLQSSIDGGATWQRVGNVNDPVNWYNTPFFFGGTSPGGANQGWSGLGTSSSGGYVTAKHDLTGLGGQSGVILRIAFASNPFANNNGFAFDDVNIYDIPSDDLGVSRILSPAGGCDLSSAESITVRIVNYGAAAQSNFPVSYQNDANTPVTETVTVTVPAQDSIDYTFSTTADFSGAGTKNLLAYTALASDAIASNNSTSSVVLTQLGISTFPYVEDFESGNGGWVASGNNSTWAYGTPAKSIIMGASSGSNAWVTGGLTGNYPNNENSALTSPCMNLSTMSAVSFSANVWWDTENGWDRAALEYSIDGGATWTLVGSLSDSNWYNSPAGFGWSHAKWSGRFANGSGGYVTVSNTIPAIAGQADVKLRFIFRSDISQVGNGFAVDDINISTITAMAPEDVLTNSISVFPNPTSGKLNIHLTQPELLGNDVNISLVDMQGRQLRSSDIKLSNVQNAALDISELASGVYFVRIISGKRLITKKVVKF